MGSIRKAVFDGAVALGFTAICITFLLEPLVEPNHYVVYHWSGSVSGLFGTTALFAGVVFLATLLLVFSARRPGRWRAAVWSGIILFLPWVLLRTMAITWPGRLPEWVVPPRFVWGFCAWVLLVALWHPATSKRYEQVIGAVSTVLAFVALSGVLFLSQFAGNWWQARRLNQPADPPAKALTSAANPSRQRIIWVVLDELSYRQVYEHRYPGLALPNFDALAADSTVFTHVEPAGIQTDRVLPSLMTGIPVDNIRSPADGQLILHNSAKRRWERFDQGNTVFADARNDGYRTGVSGWFNPYCRILPGVLDHCFWQFDEALQNGISPDGTVDSNAERAALTLLPDGPMVRAGWRLLRTSPPQDRVLEMRIEDYKDISAAGDKLLRDPSVGFMLLHMPVPHPPGFFNRRTGKLSTSGTYIDNLALADRVLGHVRQVLEQQGEWNSSTVIVMGDHSWRTQLIWTKLPEWTAEEQRASDGGKFDDRPAYIVKLAGQTSGTRIDDPYQAVRTRALMDALMDGKIRTSEDLKDWVDHDEVPSGPVRSALMQRPTAGNPY